MNFSLFPVKHRTGKWHQIFLIFLAWFLLFPVCTCLASRQVTLAWDANQESTLMGYRVFSRMAGEGYGYSRPGWDGAATTCTLTGLDENTQYAFVVRAYDIYGNESSDSNEVTLAAEPETTPPPAAGATPPPAAGASTPPAAGASTPPAAGASTPPAAGASTPPAAGASTPLAAGATPLPETTPPGSNLPFRRPNSTVIPEYNCNPILVSPEDGEDGLSLTPTFEARGCSLFSLFDQHIGTQWQIVRTADDTFIYDKVRSDSLWQLDAPAQLLNGKTTYWFRTRFIYSSGTQSKWSAYHRFTTALVRPNRPTGISPVDGAVDQFLTPVMLTDAYQNSDSEDGHMQTQWRVIRESDNICVYDLTSDVHLYALDVPPLVLEENTSYTWMVRYAGAKGSFSDWSTPNRLATGDSGLDEDGNGVPDNQEVDLSIDLDNNGIPDADQENLRCVNVLEGDGQMAVSAPDGSGVAKISAMESTDLATIGSEDRIPFDLPLGLVSFRLDMDEIGGIAKFRVYFSGPAPQSAKWMKFDITSGWQDFSSHAVFAHDRLSAEIEIQDGGFGDADGVANGIIIDPSGFSVTKGDESHEPPETTAATPSIVVDNSGSGGGGGCFIYTLWN